MQKGFALLWILVGVIVVAGIAGGAYYLGRQASPKQQTQNPVITSEATPAPIDETTNWKTYQDQKNLFEFRYPDTWEDTYGVCCLKIVAEYDLLPFQKDYDPKSGVAAPVNTKEEFVEQKSMVGKGLLPPEYETESRLIKSLKVDDKNAVQYYSLSLSGGAYSIRTTIFTDQLRINLNRTLTLKIIDKPLEENPAIMTMDNEQSIIRLDELASGKFSEEVGEEIKEHNLVLSTFRFLE